MSLTVTIKERIQAAMKSKNVVEKTILRVALGEIETIASRNGKAVNDDDAAAILRKLVEKNKEVLAIDENRAGSDILLQENEILETLIPKTLDQEEILAFLLPQTEEIQNAKSEGQATGIAMKKLKAYDCKVLGKDVAAVVTKIRTQTTL